MGVYIYSSSFIALGLILHCAQVLFQSRELLQ